MHPAPDTTDAQLIALLDRIALKHQTALRELYDLTSSKMYGLALRVVSQREAAEDVLQDAYLYIWNSAASYRASLSPPMAWIGLIVRSRGIDALRKRSSERADVTEEMDADMSEAIEGDAPNPMDTAQASQQASALHQCLTRLEKRQRELVSMAYVRDLSHSELADRLNLPLGSVKSWIRRGLNQLRTCMARYA